MNLPTRSLGTAAVALIAVASLVGCGNASAPVVASTASSSAPSMPTSTGPTSSGPTTPRQQQSQPTTQSSGAGKTHVVDAGGVKVTLPEGLTLPEGAVVDVTTPGQVILKAPEAEKVQNHYRTQLAEKGFTIDSDIGGGLLAWHSTDWEGTVISNSSSSVLQFWVPGDEPTDDESSTPEPDVVNPGDLGITEGVPFNLTFPAGTTISNLTNAETGSSFIVTAPEPTVVYDHLKQNVLHTVFFTIDSDEVTGGLGVLRFHSDDYDGELTFEKSQVKVVFTAR